MNNAGPWSALLSLLAFLIFKIWLDRRQLATLVEEIRGLKKSHENQISMQECFHQDFV